jgi:predicted dehydrogenase
MSDHTPEKPYGFTETKTAAAVAAPELPYRPRDPKTYRPNIGLIACGGITEWHLRAYQAAGYRVVALCDGVRAKAEKRRDEFFPEADVYTDYREILKRGDIDVVDVAAHPIERQAIIPDALRARKHVLSQKPFVIDLDVGLELADLADRMGVKLAVNQNARWAPYFSYIRRAIEAGVVGRVASASFEVHWDHNWTANTSFNNLHHLALYDFAIHWFDIIQVFFAGRPARRVFASIERSKSQKALPPLLGHVLVDFDDGQATLMLNGDTVFGQEERTSVIGDKGTLRSIGPDLLDQQVTLITANGQARPALEGKWLPDGMHGTMAELLCAIEEKREPENSARNNLKSLELCFAAVASADAGLPQVPGTVRRLPDSCVVRSAGV